MTKHIELVVPRLPVRDADGPSAAHAADHFPAAGQVLPLVPVHLIPGLAPAERVAELRLRVRTGVYAHPAMAERVAHAIVARRSESN